MKSDDHDDSHIFKAETQPLLVSSATRTRTTTRSNLPSLICVNLALITGQVFFGLGSVIAALGLPACNPFTFALYREFIAGLLLLLGSHVFARTKHAYPRRDHWIRFILLGLAIYGNQAGFVVGVKLAGGVAAAIWQPSQPIMTAAISMTLGWEALNGWRVLGITVAFVGCAIMVCKDGAKVNDFVAFVVGNLMFFINCLCTSLYVILSKKVLHIYPSLAVTAWSYNIAALFMALTALLTSLSDSITNFICPNCSSVWGVPPGAFFALGYFILFNSVAAYGILTWANQYATGTLVMGYTVLQPVTAALLTLLLLATGTTQSCLGRQSPSNEDSKCLTPPGWGSLSGMIGIALGLYLVITTEPKQQQKQEEDLFHLNQEKALPRHVLD